jgi:hypothetical protein
LIGDCMFGVLLMYSPSVAMFVKCTGTSIKMTINHLDSSLMEECLLT